MSIPVAIRAHPSRADWVMKMKTEFFRYADISMDVGEGGIFSTTIDRFKMAQKRAEKEGSDWCLAMDDDLVPMEGLSHHLENIVGRVPEDAGFVSLIAKNAIMSCIDYNEEKYGDLENIDEVSFIEVDDNSISWVLDQCSLVRVSVIPRIIEAEEKGYYELKRGERENRGNDVLIYDNTIDDDEFEYKQYVALPSFVDQVALNGSLCRPSRDMSDDKWNSDWFPGRGVNVSEYL